MIFNSKKTVLILLLVFVKTSIAQELFHEIEIGKKLSLKNVLFTIDLNWKKEYKTENWDRIGLNFSILKVLKNNWSVSGGLEYYYVINSKSSNNFEIRPWAMINLKSKISSTIYFSQFLKTENRFFFNSETHKYDNYNRLRYRFHFDWNIHNKSTKLSLKPGLEWYLIKNNFNGERYANSREIYLRCSIEKKEKEWNFGIKQETFITNIYPDSEKANTLFFEYKF